MEYGRCKMAVPYGERRGALPRIVIRDPIEKRRLMPGGMEVQQPAQSDFLFLLVTDISAYIRSIINLPRFFPSSISLPRPLLALSPQSATAVGSCNKPVIPSHRAPFPLAG